MYPHLHIIVPTHQRFMKFHKCMNSIYDAITKDMGFVVHVHVICDDNSVKLEDFHDFINEKIVSTNIHFINALGLQTDNDFDISRIYRYSYAQTRLKCKQNDYVMFLEDDDQLTPNSLSDIFDTIENNPREYNLLFNYKHGYGLEYENQHKMELLEFTKIANKTFQSSESLLEKYNPKHFQLGMMVFRCINLSFEKFPTDNINENDLELFKIIDGGWIVSPIKIFEQGWDGTNFSNV